MVLRRCYTAVVERAEPLEGEFFTEPYEAGWAQEALIFIRVREDLGSGLEIHAGVQISPDGIDWVDEGTIFPSIRQKGTYFVKVSNFGNWLRVAGRISDPEVQVRTSIYIVLKG